MNTETIESEKQNIKFSDKLASRLQEIRTPGSPEEKQKDAEYDKAFIDIYEKGIEEARSGLEREISEGGHTPDQIRYLTAEAEDYIAHLQAKIDALENTKAKPDDVMDRFKIGENRFEEVEHRFQEHRF